MDAREERALIEGRLEQMIACFEDEIENAQERGIAWSDSGQELDDIALVVHLQGVQDTITKIKTTLFIHKHMW